MPEPVWQKKQNRERQCLSEDMLPFKQMLKKENNLLGREFFMAK